MLYYFCVRGDNMSSKTYKKKRKKYSTRLEKNKNIYYKNNISSNKKTND